MLRYDVEKRVSDYRWIYNPWISREEKKKEKKNQRANFYDRVMLADKASVSICIPHWEREKFKIVPVR